MLEVASREEGVESKEGKDSKSVELDKELRKFGSKLGAIVIQLREIKQKASQHQSQYVSRTSFESVRILGPSASSFANGRVCCRTSRLPSRPLASALPGCMAPSTRARGPWSASRVRTRRRMSCCCLWSRVQAGPTLPVPGSKQHLSSSPHWS